MTLPQLTSRPPAAGRAASTRRARSSARRVTSVPRGIKISLLLAPAMLVVSVFFLTGITQAVAQSLGYQPFLPSWRLSLDAYRTLLTDPAVRASLLVTARIAIIPTVLSVVLGVSAALLIRRLGRSRSWVSGIFQANLAMPHLVGALCMLLLLSQGGLLSRFGHAAGLGSCLSQVAFGHVRAGFASSRRWR